MTSELKFQKIGLVFHDLGIRMKGTGSLILLLGLYEIVEFSFRTIWNQIFQKQCVVKTMGTSISKMINF